MCVYVLLHHKSCELVCVCVCVVQYVCVYVCMSHNNNPSYQPWKWFTYINSNNIRTCCSSWRWWAWTFVFMCNTPLAEFPHMHLVVGHLSARILSSHSFQVWLWLLVCSFLSLPLVPPNQVVFYCYKIYTFIGIHKYADMWFSSDRRREQPSWVAENAKKG